MTFDVIFFLQSAPISPPTLAVFGEFAEVKYTTEFSVLLPVRLTLVSFESITSPKTPPTKPSVLRSASLPPAFLPFCEPLTKYSAALPDEDESLLNIRDRLLICEYPRT